MADARAALDLLAAVARGQRSGLACPACGQPCVCVEHTYPAPGERWTWCRCGACGFEMRAQGADDGQR